MNDPSVKPPAQCQSMTEVRRGVDSLDRDLVRLMAERQQYMLAAARLKNSRDTVRDETRIAEVLNKVMEAAATHHLAREIAEPVWRELIERSIDYELQAWDGLRKSAKP